MQKGHSRLLCVEVIPCKRLGPLTVHNYHTSNAQVLVLIEVHCPVVGGLQMTCMPSKLWLVQQLQMGSDVDMCMQVPRKLCGNQVKKTGQSKTKSKV